MNEVVQLSELITDMLNDREKTHGKAENTFFVGVKLTEIIANYINDHRSHGIWQTHDYAVLGIINKIARIICGSYSKDHWDDIIGYAKLGKELHKSRGDDKSDGESN